MFWREHGEVLIRQEGYHEAACQIILMAFLHRLVNGGGQLDREYAAGTKRLDVLVRWPYTGPEGERLMQREAMELKVWRAGENDPTARRPRPARPLPGPPHPLHRRAGDLRPAPRGPALEGTRRFRTDDHPVRPPGHRSACVNATG